MKNSNQFAKKFGLAAVPAVMFLLMSADQASAGDAASAAIGTLVTHSAAWGGGLAILAAIGVIAVYMFSRDEFTQLLSHLSRWVIGGALIVGIVIFAGYFGIAQAAGAML